MNDNLEKIIIECQSGNIEEFKKGRVDIQSNNCSIKLFEIEGSIKIDNSFGSVSISNIFGDLYIRNRNGRIEINKIKKISTLYNIENEFGEIDISFPSDLSGIINATTYFGNIETDFSLNINKLSYNKIEAFGKIGDGYSNIKLETKNEKIKIRKSE